jgi:LacI family transcriptional regulator
MCQRRVALLIESSLGYGRGLLRGIVEYAKHHGPWAFYVTPGDLVQRVPKLVEWGATGIIARIWTPQVGKAILETGLPVIALDLNRQQLASGSPLADICELCPDSVQAGRLAAEHLLDRGVRRFVFVGAFDDPLWSTRREEGFRDRVAQAGLPCDVYPLPRSRAGREWAREQITLGRWLSDFPRPLGVLACDDDRGRQVLEACRGAGLWVPDDVAVVGVDNDDLLCELSDPPLSSVALDTRRAGYEAAELLDELMQGRFSGTRRILVRPMGVVARRSTQGFALEDREVATALRFIHDNAGQPIGVSDVVRHVALSRRTLELCFHRVLGRTIHDELIGCRLRRAKLLLRDTTRSVAEVASAAGFGSSCHMYRVFRKYLGCPPSEWARSKLAP